MRINAMTKCAALFLVFLVVSPVAHSSDVGGDQVTKLGERFAADIATVLSEYGVKSVAVYGFVSRDARGRSGGREAYIDGVNGLLPNRIDMVVNQNLTNMNRFRVMPTGLRSARFKRSKITTATFEDKEAVQAFLGDDYETMVYGFVDKVENTDQIRLSFHFITIKNGAPSSYESKYEEFSLNKNDPSTLVFTGDNFPPLFNETPNREASPAGNGMLSGGPSSPEISVFVRVGGKRLDFLKRVDNGVTDNQLTVKIPMGSEYEIELFDKNPKQRTNPAGTGERGNRRAAAVLIDGLNSIGTWANKSAGEPSTEDFLRCDDPSSATKWVLSGTGEDADDGKGNKGKSVFIRGWQTSASRGNRFKFSKTEESLAFDTNQVGPNLGIIVVCIYEEIEKNGSKDIERATSMGQQFENNVRLVSIDFKKEPVQVVNIRCVPVDAEGNSGDAGEGLQPITR